MKFEITATSSKSLARLGQLTTPHGQISMPTFMPVGTSAAVKTLAPWELEELGAQIILANAYHLHLRPGSKLIADQGGLHKWMNWPKPILTDSGGYQAYSLGTTRSKMAKTTNDGVRFYSHLDGAKHMFTPESVLDVQADLGSDIAMVLDDCPPIDASEKRVESAVIRTTNWAKQSIDYWQKHDNNGRALFGIIQGGLFENLRLRSMDEIQALPVDGIAIGGVAIASEGKDKINQAVDFIAPKLDQSRPHYLMGVGEPTDLINMIHRGMDMFDCVLPTRLARHGAFWTGDYQRLDIRLSKFKQDSQPLDPNCQCLACQHFSRSYLRHLFINKEMLASRMLSYHNLWVIFRLLDRIHQAIANNRFVTDFAQFLG